MKIIHDKKILIIISIIVIILITLLIYFFQDDKVIASNNDNILDIKEVEQPVKEEKIINDIYVEIKGAVVTPGVYTLKEGSRVIDLINLAGGLNNDANIDYINQSKILEDQMVIKIYTNKEIEDSNKVEVVTKYVEKECNCPNIKNDGCISTNNDNQSISSSSSKVNINSCTLDELLTLPGIGESKALAIFDYRKNNKFNTIEDIKNVTGIGQSLYDKIKDYIEV